MENNNILVSISCITYNQEYYISRALDSFLMQKTNFEYEILIHDDASTDRTAEIIKEYEEKYPYIIKPIYQSVNQYSKGVKIGKLNDNRALGKYIASCEGDDYWIDSHKLQKQVNYMELHTDCSLCVHAANTVDYNGKQTGYRIRPNIGNRKYTFEDMLVAGGGLFATNSMLYRVELIENLPDFYYSAPVGDYPLQIYLSLLGEVYYLDEVMSAYRINAINSWTNEIVFNDFRIIEHTKRIIFMFNEINKFTKGKYSYTIGQCILVNMLYISLIKNDKVKIKGIRSQINIKLFGTNYKRLYLYSKIPLIYRTARKLKLNLLKVKVKKSNKLR
ncbi:MAG: glycosyltransferase [Gudongella sp.]|nr:glycosyltransferase [Gudongella sp.]